MTVRVETGSCRQIVNRKGYGISFCATPGGKLVYYHNGNQYVSDSDHAVILPKGQTYMLYGKQTGDLIHTDFAMIARGYGMKGYTATTMKELEEALEAAKNDTVSNLIDIKVLPKTMTDGYLSWWNVGLGDSKTNENIHASYENRMAHLDKARMY